MAKTALSLPLSFPLSLDSSQPLFLKSQPLLSLNNTTNTNTNTDNNKALSLSYSPSSSSQHPLLHKFHRLNAVSPSSPSPSPSPSSYSSHLLSLKTDKILDAEGIQKGKILTDFSYLRELQSGSLSVLMMGDAELDMTVNLLTEAFYDSMSVPSRFMNFLEFMVKHYLMERRSLVPHAAILVGYFKGEGGKAEIVGTVEVSFDLLGANASPQTPIPPKSSPYICNMAVKKGFRRKGIGWHLLQAAEQLISLMTTTRDVYLHCRMIDQAPLAMYKKAGYNVIKTDSIFTLLWLQQRKHLMCKILPQPHTQESNTSPEPHNQELDTSVPIL